LGRPAFLVLLDPKRFTEPVVFVCATSDAATLRRNAAPPASKTTLREANGYAALGHPQTVETVAGYALGVLAKSPAPPAPRITLYASRLLAIYQNELDAGLHALAEAVKKPEVAAHFGRLLELEIDLFLDLARATDRLVVSLDVSRAGATFETALVARPGSA